MSKKSKSSLPAKVDSRKVRILAAVPAVHRDHSPYLERVKAAVQACIEAAPEFAVEFVVDPSPDNSVAETNSWDVVVAKFQALSDRVVAEKFDCLWLVEADVIPPANALSHLYRCSADVAAAVVPYHFANDEYWEQYGYAKGQRPIGGDIFMKRGGMACTGYFLPDAEGKPTFSEEHLYVDDVRDRVVEGSSEHRVYNGTGCILIKRSVLERVRWRWDNKVSGFDLYFWFDVQGAGFRAVTDGWVVCQHLGK